MRRAAAALLLGLAACSPAPPKDVQNLASAYDTSSFSWTKQPERLVFLRGRYPEKSYLAVQSLISRREKRFRFPGHSLYRVFGLAGEDRAIAATIFLGEGMHPRQSPPPQRALLLVDTRTGSILKEASLPEGAAVVYAGRPAGTRKPLVVFFSGGAARLAEFDTDGLSPALLRLEGAQPAWITPLPEGPRLALTSPDRRLLLYDLEAGKVLGGVPIDKSIEVLGWQSWNVVLAAQRALAGRREALFAVDLVTGNRQLLRETEGSFEQALATPLGVFAISSLPQEKALNPGEKDFRKRTLHLLDPLGGVLWSQPWTKRKGEFLGFDVDAGRLLFAVTDGDAPGAWSLKAGRNSLAAAVPRLDEGPGVLPTALMRIGLIIAGGAVMAGMIAAMRAFRR